MHSLTELCVVLIVCIEAPASNGKATNNDIYVINADCVEKLSIEDGTPAETLKSIDFVKVIFIIMQLLSFSRLPTLDFVVWSEH